MVDNADKLSMSKFANHADFCAAVVAREGYDPDDAFNDGEATWFEGGRGNPYNPDAAPVCFAAWNRGLNGRAAIAEPTPFILTRADQAFADELSKVRDPLPLRGAA